MATKMEDQVGVNFAIFRSNPWRQFIELLKICCKETNIHKSVETIFPIFGSVRLKMSEPVMRYNRFHGNS